MKKIIAGAGLAALALVATGFAQAATIGTVSGGSSATATARFKTNWAMTSANQAMLGNSVTVTGDSGHNTLTSSGDMNNIGVATGNSVSTAVVENSANTNNVTVSFESAGGASNAIGSAEGGSSADATFRNRERVTVDAANSVLNENGVTSLALTGGAVLNAGGALNNVSIVTGSNDAAAGLTNGFNVNIKSVTRTIRIP